MKAGSGPSSTKSAARQIDAMIRDQDDWRGETLSRLRALISDTDPDVVEEVKWKKPSNPLGVPVWSSNGIVCIGNVLKRSVRLTFPKGAKVKDPKRLFNSRLDSRTVRAIDFYEGDAVDKPALSAIVLEALELNRAKARS